MNFIEVFLLGVGLSMDAFAVSVTDGMCIQKLRISNVFAIAVTFGLFQAIMPLTGYLCGSLFYKQISSIDHWIALILLGFLGIRMIFEGAGEMRKSYRMKKGEPVVDSDTCAVTGGKITFRLLMVQGIATSIDALAVGISLAAVDAPIVSSAFLIGLTTTILCIPAVFIGKRSGDLLNDKAQIFGGCILVAIGLKIFLQHTGQ